MIQDTSTYKLIIQRWTTPSSLWWWRDGVDWGGGALVGESDGVSPPNLRGTSLLRVFLCWRSHPWDSMIGIIFIDGFRLKIINWRETRAKGCSRPNVGLMAWARGGCIMGHSCGQRASCISASSHPLTFSWNIEATKST
jgi:hypothetical protein